MMRRDKYNVVKKVLKVKKPKTFFFIYNFNIYDKDMYISLFFCIIHEWCSLSQQI